MSYIAKCTCCDCPIYMPDDFDEADVRICDECRDDLYRGLNPNAEDSK
jgi:hypothetical protein